MLAAVLIKSKVIFNTEQYKQPLHSSPLGKQLVTLSCKQALADTAKKLTIHQYVNNDNRAEKSLQVSLVNEALIDESVDNDHWTEQVEILEITRNNILYLYQDVIKTRSFAFDENPATPSLWLSNIAGNLQFIDHSLISNKTEKTGSDQVLASMDGVVAEILVNEGDHVVSGDVIAIIEAMKMEHLLKASIDGCIEKILTATGNQVKARQLLVQLEQSN